MWSQGDYDHALYMVKNDLVTHYETPGVPYYTTDGDTAAQNSNIYVSSTTATTDDQAIDWWMQAPFHAIGMMDPRLTQTGFGSYREVKSGWQMGAALDVLRGNSFSGGQYPVYFPGNGAIEPLTSYGGNEFPDPLQYCPGYTVPAGLPVVIQVGGNVATTVGPVHTIVGNGVSLPNCAIDSHSTSNLTSRGGVILIPQQPLQQGVMYTVALTVNGIAYTWSFTVGTLGTVCGAAPSVMSISPSTGPGSGGTTVNINGCGFAGVTGVKFGATSASGITFITDSQITAVSPAHASGTVDVTVTTARGTSLTSSADLFFYSGPPGPPLNVSATVGNLSATVAWTPPASDGGAAITTYTVMSAPGGLTSTVSGSAYTAVVSGLTLGVKYTFTVAAANVNGPGTASAPSNQITAVTVPSAPTSVKAVAADGSAMLTWTAPTSDGGSPVTAYLVTPHVNGVAGTAVMFLQPNLMEVIFGLTNGTSYTFTVVAVNAAGGGASSGPSNAVLPNSAMRQPSAQGASSGAASPRATVQTAPAPSPPAR